MALFFWNELTNFFILVVDKFIQIGNTFGSLQDTLPTPEEGEASPKIYTRYNLRKKSEIPPESET